MMKYVIPGISVHSFMTECVVTSSGVSSQYIQETEKLMGIPMTPEQYKARTESIKQILSFSTES